MPFETTVIGSHPPVGKDIDEQIKNAVNDQIEAGVYAVSDGQPRTDMISYVAEAIKSFKKGPEDKWYITDKIKPALNPGFVGKLQKDYAYLKKLCGEKAKPALMFAGPVTMVFNATIENGIYGEKFKPAIRNPGLYIDMAEAILELIKAIDPLQEAHAIHIDEPFISQGTPMAQARKATEYLAGNIRTTTNLHICGNVTKLFPELLEWKGIDVLSHGFKGKEEKNNREIFEKYMFAEHGKTLGLGCVASDTKEIDNEDDVLDLIGDAMEYQQRNMVVHPSCGFRVLPREVAKEKLSVMCRATLRIP